MLPLLPRLKLVVAEYGLLVVGMLAVVSVLAFGAAGWLYVNPPTEAVTEPAYEETVATDVETQARVTGNTSLWERGTTLVNRPIYPANAAPNVTLVAHAAVPVGESVDVTQELTLVYEAKKDEVTFWETEELLTEDRKTVQDGRSTTTTTIDISAVRNQLNRYNNDIAGLGHVTAKVRYNVSYATNRYSGTLSKTVPLEVTAKGYWLKGSFDAEKIHSATVQRQVADEPDLTAIAGLLAAGTGSLLGAAAVAIVRRRRLDADAVLHELHRLRCSEWISQGELRQAISGQDIAMRTLEDLVNVAVDSNNRVVFDPDRDLYAVVNRGVIYYFDPQLSVGTFGATFDPQIMDTGAVETENGQEIESSHDAWDQFVEEVSDG